MILLHPVKKVFLPLLYAVIKNQHCSKYRILVLWLISYETTFLLIAIANKAATRVTPQIPVSPTYPMGTLANTMLNFLTPANPKSPLLGIHSKRNGNNLYRKSFTHKDFH